MRRQIKAKMDAARDRKADTTRRMREVLLPDAGVAVVDGGAAYLKKPAFLAAYAECSSLKEAARVAGVNPRAHYAWMRDDPEYAAMFAEAEVHAGKALEDEAVRRATVGWNDPVYHQGQVCGYVTKRSDTLLIFLMKGFMPAKYADRMQHTGSGGGPIQTVDWSNYTIEELEQLEKIAAAARERIGKVKAPTPQIIEAVAVAVTDKDDEPKGGSGENL